MSAYINNLIFDKVKYRAMKLLSNRYRLLALITVAGKKLYQLEDRQMVAKEIRDKVFVLGRLLKAFTTGDYKSLPWKSAIAICASILYFVNPADIVPDIIPFTGFMDDFSILIWTYKSLESELEKFIAWENSNLY